MLYTTQVWPVALEEPRRAGEIRIVGRLVRARLSSWSLGSISAWLGSCPRTECSVFAMEPSLALHLPSPILASGLGVHVPSCDLVSCLSFIPASHLPPQLGIQVHPAGSWQAGSGPVVNSSDSGLNPFVN